MLGDADPSMVLPADFIIPYENIYTQPPPTLWIDLKSINLYAPVDSVHTTPTEETPTPLSEVTDATSATKPAEIRTYPASITFSVTSEDQSGSTSEREHTLTLAKDVYFVTAHPCVPSQHVKFMKSPTSPTIQQVDLSGHSAAGGKTASVIGTCPVAYPSACPPHLTKWYFAGHPLHKYYTYLPIHLSTLLSQPDSTTLESLLSSYPSTAHRPSLTPASNQSAKVLVIDCITNFASLPQEHEIPLSPTVSRTSSLSAEAPPVTPVGTTPGFEAAGKKMHHETRRRQFGSDMEVLVRAVCAEKGWNAVVSRRRRGCLACAIREAGALGWRVVIRVD